MYIENKILMIIIIIIFSKSSLKSFVLWYKVFPSSGVLSFFLEEQMRTVHNRMKTEKL